jgi:dTDP-glucose 4,6-dehydratase
MQQTIVITGGAGFVGVNLVRYAHQKGYHVIVVDAGDRLQRLEHLYADSGQKPLFVPLNLAKEVLILEQKVDAMIHLAALPHVDYSRYFPAQVTRNNINALLNVLEFVQECRVPILFVSSIEVYGGNEEGLFYENDPYQPLSPYAVSKESCEKLLHSFINTTGIVGSTARLTNLYGPWQAPDRIIPRLITQILSGYRCEVDGGRMRDYLSVDDAVKAILGIVERNLWNETFNISSGQGYDNYSLVSLLQEASQYTINISYIDAKQGDGRGRSLISSSQKLQAALAWQPTISLSDGIRQTYDWYAEHHDWWRQFDENIKSDRSGPHFLTDYTHKL